jgi:hypothetical protein
MCILIIPLAQTEELLAAAARGSAPQHGVHLAIGSYGDLASLHWAHSAPPPAGNALCDVAFGPRFPFPTHPCL